MSVLIKGITLDDFIRFGGEYAGYLDGIGCTVELPDHGDLVDKNRIVEILRDRSKNVFEIQKGVKNEKDISYCQGVMVGYTNSIVALEGAPVVIPAERSEE